jgi:hypothetical protein
MTPNLEPIRAALKAGDKKSARGLIRPLLKEQPSADLWTLAAQACDREEDAIKCLRKALEIDPYHNRANTLLLKLEGVKPLSELERERSTAEMPRVPVKADALPLKKVKYKRKRNPWRTVGCLSFFLLGSACSLFTLNMVGLISGVFTATTILLGGPTPVSEWQGVPLAQVSGAPAVVPASQSEFIGESRSEDDRAVRTLTGGQDIDVLEHGYSHEYKFQARGGNQYAVYVQFLSLDANRVSRNVAVLRPDGSEVTSRCQRNRILEGDNNIAYVCDVDTTGVWSVRILGRSGESVGVYFVGIERVQG